MAQNRESNQKELIRSSLIELSACADETKMIYCLVDKGTYENKMGDSLVKATAKKATHLTNRG